MSPKLTRLAPAAVILLGSLSLGGCATKGFVRDQIAAVNQRIDGLDAKLNATDGIARNAQSTAQGAAGQAQANGQKIDQLNARVDGVEQRLTAAEAARQKRPRN